MDCLWMGAAVDAAPERPVTAAAGYRAAEAKHGRDHVLKGPR